MDGDEQDDRSGAAHLLPFYVNGTLPPADRARVEAALACDPDLRAELEAVSKIAALVREGGADFTGPAEDASPERLKGLLSRIEARDAASPPVQATARRVRRAGTAVGAGRAKTPQALWRRAFAAAAVVAVVQAGVIAYQMSPRGDYESLSGPPAPAPVKTPRLLLRLSPDARWGEVQTFLSSHHLTIVGGPRGAVIEVALGADVALEAEIEALRASPLVDFVGVES
ncbi:anti-sigma factor [Phenylobacterium sp.]|uniref:anti-sigma factor family protein n=1 Tax=Phenylobacterium sp. TaxID=1871053 RepID=UPI00271E9B00|nr:hypothetical protein [Phenylobacterium sp.]MDO8380311.1 hypothetical protein [Phenylobacterium sp.]